MRLKVLLFFSSGQVKTLNVSAKRMVQENMLKSPKSWMQVEISGQLTRQIMQQNRNEILFVDNVLCTQRA